MTTWLNVLLVLGVLIVLFFIITGVASAIIRKKPDCTDVYFFYGRTKKPFWKKLLPIWWLMNDDEQTVDQATWYMPGEPHWKRWLYWNVFRNPAQNLSAFVLGVQDKNYKVVGKYPVLTIQRDDLRPQEYGYHYTVIEKLLGLPFVSYCDQKKVWYIGWQPNGFFRMKYNRN